MKTKLVNIIASAAVLLGIVILPGTAVAQVDPNSAKGAVCSGAAVAGNACGDANAGANTINNIIATVINILSVLVGVVSVIFIIIGGFKYVTSNGDSNAMTSARQTILYAIAGLVIVFMAQIIVQFVLNRIST